MSNALPSHGALMAYEVDPVVSPGVFTTVAEIVGDLKFPDLNTRETECTPHNDNIDSYRPGVLSRANSTFDVNWVFNNSTHDHLTGMLSCVIDRKLRGFRFRGPGGTSGSNEWICSGYVTNMTNQNPARTGIRTSTVTIRPSGLMKIDGVVIGA